MKTILHTILTGLLLLFAGGAAKAQISLSQTTLTWEAGSTQTKSVQVTSNGWWQTDSTLVENHFAISPQTGPSGSYINITPTCENAFSEAVTGGVEIYDSGNAAILYLVHEAPAVSLSLSTDHLHWAWHDVGAKTVTVSCNFTWTASLSSDAFIMERSGNTLTFIPKNGRNDTATPRTGTLAVNCGNSTLIATLYQVDAPYFSGLNDTTSYIQKTTFLSPNGASYTRDVSYYDGLGYPIQDVAVAASPTGGSLVTPIVYDNMRRGDAITYLPYVRASGTAALDGSSDALSAQAAFYTGFCHDAHPYAVKEYGSSPLGHVKSVRREGDAWAAGNGHKATISRTGYTTSDAVMKLCYVHATQSVPAHVTCDETLPYTAGTLRRVRTTDEDGCVSDTFSDAFGRTVCTRTWSGTNATGTTSDTYYVRDLRDSVVLVLQPEGASALNAAQNKTIYIGDYPDSLNNDIYRHWCFSYRYEARGNCIEEHVPDGGTTQRVFDTRNRLILETNDALSATENGDPFLSEPRYIRTVYDTLNRVIEKRVVTTDVPHLTLVAQAREDNPYNVLDENAITTWVTFYEATYFSFNGFLWADWGFVADGVASYADLETVNVKGLLSMELIGEAPAADGTVPEEGGPCITRRYYYDKFGRVIQLSDSDSQGWESRYSTKYDFAGRVVAKRESHHAPGDQSGQDLLTQYTYDSRGRLLSISRELDGETLAPVTYSYDSLGRISSKSFGGISDDGYGIESFTYDIHGWTTVINTFYNGTALFQEALNYASVQKPGSDPRWNGNIAEAAFTDPDGSHAYAYTYDGMNRLKDAKHYAGESNTVSNQCTERNIGYNRNGCVTGLERYGADGLSEALTIGHNGNRLSVYSAWKNGGLLGNGYFSYDAMGNMLTDSRKGLQFSYNLANLPSVVRRADGETLTYTYLADGTKWSAAPSTGNSLRYHGSFVYEDDGNTLRPSSVAWDEGRISYHFAPEMAVADTLVVDFGEEIVVDSLVVEVGDSLVVEDGICDEWHVRDHLGSVRAVVGIGNYITGIREMNTYLPFGTRLPGSVQAAENRHRFSGKEEQGFGLDPTTGTPSFSTGHLDFGARYYDPYTCRWTTIDPMAGKYHSLSPYNYCVGNPTNLVDPNGSIIDTFLDATSLAIGVKSFVSNVKQGKVGAAIVDGIGIVADAAALVTPFVSAGAGVAIKVVRGTDKVVDAAKAINRADDVADAAKAATSVEKTAKSGTKTYQTYTKTNPITGEVYVGRTSGTGTPKQNVLRRDKNHHMNKKGFGSAQLDKSSSNPAAIRGQEQYMIELNGGAKSMGGTSGNSINGVSPRNPHKDEYEEARRLSEQI